MERDLEETTTTDKSVAAAIQTGICVEDYRLLNRGQFGSTDNRNVPALELVHASEKMQESKADETIQSLLDDSHPWNRRVGEKLNKLIDSEDPTDRKYGKQLLKLFQEKQPGADHLTMMLGSDSERKRDSAKFLLDKLGKEDSRKEAQTIIKNVDKMEYLCKLTELLSTDKQKEWGKEIVRLLGGNKKEANAANELLYMLESGKTRVAEKFLNALTSNDSNDRRFANNFINAMQTTDQAGFWEQLTDFTYFSDESNIKVDGPRGDALRDQAKLLKQLAYSKDEADVRAISNLFGLFSQYRYGRTPGESLLTDLGFPDSRKSALAILKLDNQEQIRALYRLPYEARKAAAKDLSSGDASKIEKVKKQLK